MTRLFFDTCFLIDLEREMRRGRDKAHRFLQKNATARPCLSWTVAGEFAEGFGDIHHPACAAMLSRFEIFPTNQATAHHYAVITRHLRGLNQLIGSNDLWIASAALAKALPLVTNNAIHFTRIPNLSVMTY